VRIVSMVSPMKLQADRMRFAGRKDVDDAAADSEFTLLVCRILAGETGVDEELCEVGWRDVVSRLELQRRRLQTLGRGHARQQAAADAMTMRAVPRAMAWQARVHAPMSRRCAATVPR
jgi:hypothetical protein